MKKFNEFYFEDFAFNKDNLTAEFSYSFDKKYVFTEKIIFDKKINIRDDFSDKKFQVFLFNIFIALWISYYKAYPTEKLVSEKYYLDEKQKEFWKKFYLNWLWEFLFRNKIKPDNLLNFDFRWENNFKKQDYKVKNRVIIPIWWGKDSLVSVEEIKKNNNFKDDFILATFWKDYYIHRVCEEEIWAKRLFIERKISEKLFELNKAWNYNWHVPITWIIAFVLLASSYLYDYKFIALSNEKSANFWNLKWEWIEVNHQYSKSLEFELDFKNYQKNYIGEGIEYFSLLRNMYEVKIAEIFAKNKKYFDVFSSCNANFKILEEKQTLKNRWCNNCPKCAFVFSILRPFLDKEEVIKIFWEDLYKREDLLELFKELLWVSNHKPFECVGTNEEVIISMKKSLEKYNNKKLPVILKYFLENIDNKISEKEYKKLEEKLYKIYEKNHNIPEIFLK